MPVVDVLDSTMYHEETGEGAPVVFLHGNPASSHLWREVLPVFGSPGRLLAPDLVGMGRSGKPDGAYRFADHARYLDAWFDALGLDRVVLVGHDWGGTLAFDLAARHPGRVRGIAFMETIVRPMSRAELSAPARERFETLRTPEGGQGALSRNDLVDAAFTRGVLSPLDEEEIAPYRAPYPDPDSRRPLLAWARSLPLDGEPADVAERLDGYRDWLATSDDVPKLLLTFDSSPTLLITEDMAAWCATHMAALEREHCGPAGHHAPEDRPEAIGAAVASWADRHGLR
ncbi:haloalkane dehalogenase [Nocardiopsis sp. FIRDI 009]|uniref:haloalkane dehalogenase n=1 Tax=Nocardiopsis sp. FIRDI 009 TaxID=714197 RepID=UPI000E25D9BD|nr:haloalkane dehalogenase [Nocardiopsis sp. FIRDI 009]